MSADPCIPPHRKIVAIAKRWRQSLIDRKIDKVPLLIDITLALMIADMNGLPLDTDALLAAPIDELEHDVGGIFCDVNRGTGKLDGLFQPRHIRRTA